MKRWMMLLCFVLVFGLLSNRAFAKTYGYLQCGYTGPESSAVEVNTEKQTLKLLKEQFYIPVQTINDGALYLSYSKYSKETLKSNFVISNYPSLDDTLVPINPSSNTVEFLFKDDFAGELSLSMDKRNICYFYQVYYVDIVSMKAMQNGTLSMHGWIEKEWKDKNPVYFGSAENLENGLAYSILIYPPEITHSNSLDTSGRYLSEMLETAYRAVKNRYPEAGKEKLSCMFINWNGGVPDQLFCFLFYDDINEYMVFPFGYSLDNSEGEWAKYTLPEEHNAINLQPNVAYELRASGLFPYEIKDAILIDRILERAQQDPEWRRNWLGEQ